MSSTHGSRDVSGLAGLPTDVPRVLRMLSKYVVFHGLAPRKPQDDLPSHHHQMVHTTWKAESSLDGSRRA